MPASLPYMLIVRCFTLNQVYIGHVGHYCKANMIHAMNYTNLFQYISKHVHHAPVHAFALIYIYHVQLPFNP